MGKILRSITVSAALALIVSLVPYRADAFHGPAHFAVPCATPASTDCIVSFAVGSTNGLGGTAFPAGLTIDAFYTSGALNVQMKQTAPIPDQYELSPLLNATTEFTVTVRLPPSFTPTLVFAAAKVSDWRWDVAKRELTMTAYAVEASWANVCSPGNCPDNAEKDYAALALMAVEDAVIDNAPPDAVASMAEFLAKYNGGYVSTSAQYFAPPFYRQQEKKLYFDLGAPHFKKSNALNTGFFRVLVPDPVISDLWGLDLGSFSAGNISVTVGGTPTTTTLTRVTGRAPFADGWLFEKTGLGFSTPRVEIAPAAAASVPAAPVAPRPDDGGAPTVPDSAIAGPVVREGPVRSPLSGVLAVPVTVKGAGASLLFPAGTALTTGAGGAFSGILQAPFRSGDPTGGKLVSATTLLATGGPDRINEILLSRPARLTLPVPAGESALDHQAVFVENGKLSFLTGTLTADGIAVDVDRLTDRHTTYGLMKVVRPAAAPVLRSIPTEPGLHARWAGQSEPVDLIPGQLIDATVRLLNTGDRPWIRGQVDKQVTLGTLDDTAYRQGLIAAPLWGSDRVATSEEQFVLPGEVGRFVVRLRAPLTSGTYRVYVRPVVDGVAWLEDEGVYVEVVVR